MNSPLHGARENNSLPLQTIIDNQSSEASASAADRTGILLPINNNSDSAISARMKWYFHHEQNCFLDYFDDPVPDDTVI